MTDIEKAKRLFRESGLAFPTIPDELAARVKEQGEWLFSTRQIKMSPYNLGHYVREADVTHVEDYALLGHAGHGMNSYALHYYIVYGTLRMFLQLSWGGAYMDGKAATVAIRDCFSLADKIVPATQTLAGLRAEDRLTIVGSDFSGSYWLPPGKRRQGGRVDSEGPAEVLVEVLRWLSSIQPGPQLMPDMGNPCSEEHGRTAPPAAKEPANKTLYLFKLQPEETVKQMADRIWDEYQKSGFKPKDNK